MNTTMNYPLLLTPYLKGTIWGGSRLTGQWGKTFDGRLGESWELTVRESPKERCVIANGPLSGLTLNDCLGEKAAGFPLLVKLLDAGDNLSVQVHPVKSEVWYVLDCDEGAELILGLNRPYDREEFRAALNGGTLSSLLRRVKVHPGDCYFIPQGLIHAIGAGILVAEIQDNSDITYRVYDYDRRQPDGSLRELHVEQALGTIRDYTDAEIERLRTASGAGPDVIASCGTFTARRVRTDGCLPFEAAAEYSHLLCIGGAGEIGGVPVTRGSSVYVPREAGTVRLCGRMELIESFA